jgi:hypothetical protein
LEAIWATFFQGIMCEMNHATHFYHDALAIFDTLDHIWVQNSDYALLGLEQNPEVNVNSLFCSA